MGFPRQAYWGGLLCTPPGDLPKPGIKPEFPESPALQADSFSAFAIIYVIFQGDRVFVSVP